MDEARRCTARAKSTGERCKRAAAVGATVCVKHGAGAPQVRAAAAARIAVEGARAAVATFGLPRDVEPHVALLEEVHRGAGVVAWLAFKVSELADPAGADVAWVRLYGEERDRMVRAAKAAIDAGVSERMVRLAEMQAEVLARVIRGILTDLGVADRPEVPAVVRHHLSLAAGEAA